MMLGQTFTVLFWVTSGLFLLSFTDSSTAQRSGDLRLVRNGFTSLSYTSGRLEIYWAGQWGTVCDDFWSSTNTLVACRQLGFSGAIRWTTSSSGGFGTTSRRIWLDNVRCRGTESRLTSCSRNLFGNNNCFHSEDVAIFCRSSATASSGDLRLVRNGLTSSSYTSGRLEIYWNGEWGTVCDDFWSTRNTQVACRQLGFSGSSTSWTRSITGGYGTTSRRIWLDNVRCRGTESRLTSCSRNSFGNNNCFHFEDVAINCNAGNVVGIAVGVSIAGFILLVVLPIVICVVIGCCYSKRRSSRHSTVTTTMQPIPPTVTVNTTNTHGQQDDFQSHPTTTQPVPPTVTVNTTNTHSQQDGFQSHPVAGTGINQAPPQTFEMSAYPPTVQAAYPPPTHASYIPTYPPRQA